MHESVTKPRIRARVSVPIDIRHGRSVSALMFSFAGLSDASEHLALVIGKESKEPMVRLHSECLTGDVFASLRCDCGAQLRESLELMEEQGGIVLYMRQEGRGIGLYRKLDAYLLQDEGMDTFAANRCLKLPADAREYRASAEMLQALGVESIRIISNNPDKVEQLQNYGIKIRQQIPTGAFLTSANEKYLRAKVELAGHSIQL